MAAATATDVQKAYLAYFGRPADPVGLAYWTGKDTATMKAGFAASVEYATLYAGMTSAQMVAQVYTNLLGRTAEAAGLLYWSNALANGTATVSTLVDQMQANALGDDVTTINNRVTYATAFTAALDTTAEIVGYSGTAAANAARAAVLPITTDATLTTATAALNTSVSTVTTASTSVSSGVAGLTFTLTNGTDTFAPNTAVVANQTTANDDTFRVTAAGDLVTADYVDGGAGNDTMNVTALAANIQPVIKNVETINVTFTGGNTLTMTDSSGYTNLNSVGSVTGATIANAALTTAVGVKDNAAAIANATFSFAGATGGSDSVTVNLADAQVTGGGGGTGLIINSIENLTINSNAGSLAAVTANSIQLTADSVSTLTLAGDQALTVITSAATTEVNLATVNASAMTKNLVYTTSGGAVKTGFAFTSGSGADTLTFTGAAKKLAIDSGAGADIVNADLFNGTTINLGAGADVLNLKGTAGTALAAGDIATASALAAAVISVSGFVSGSDVINVKTTVGGAAGEIAVSGPDLATIAGSSSLLTATQAAAALTGNAQGAVVTFQYGGDTYLFINESGADATLGAGDALVKLAGVTSVVAADITTY